MTTTTTFITKKKKTIHLGEVDLVTISTIPIEDKFKNRSLVVDRAIAACGNTDIELFAGEVAEFQRVKAKFDHDKFSNN